MKCPHCEQNITQVSAEEGVAKRFRIVEKSLKQAKDGTVRAQCFWCKAEVILPLRMTEATQRFVAREPPT